MATDEEWGMYDPVNILALLPKEFYEQIQDPKWLIKKEMLDKLKEILTKNPKLDPSGNYGELITTLNNLISKDKNIHVVAGACSAMAGVANGLRKKFSPFVTGVLPSLFEKLKEKKQVVTNAVTEALDAVAKTVSLESIQEDVLAALGHKTPSVKIHTSYFLQRTMRDMNQQMLPKKVLKPIAEQLVKNVQESDPGVRESAAAALGSAMKAVGEKPIMVFLAPIANDTIKIDKIKDYYSKAETECETKKKPAAPQLKTSTSKKEEASGGGLVTEGKDEAEECMEEEEEVEVEEEIEVEEEESDPWEMYDPVNILNQLPESFYDQIQMKAWKERKEALDKLVEVVAKNPRLDPSGNYGELVSTLGNVIQKDNNINCVTLAGNAITGIAKGLRKKFSPFAQSTVGIILEKFKEKKQLVVTALVDAIDAVIKTITLELVLEDTVGALANKSPGVKIQTGFFLQRTLREMNQQTLPKKILKPIVDQLAKNILESDPDVRESAAAALGSAMKAVGEKPIHILLGTIAEDPLKMEKIKAFCAKAEEDTQKKKKIVKKVVKKTVTKTTGTVKTGTAAAKVKMRPAVTNDAPVSTDDVQIDMKETVPEVDAWDVCDAVDILVKLPVDFYEQLQSKKWSERKAAVDGLLDLLNANPRLDPAANYGEIVNTLIHLVSKDVNINVVAAAANCLGGFASGLRKKFTPHAPPVVPCILDKFKEKKQVVVAALSEAIDAVGKTVMQSRKQFALDSTLEIIMVRIRGAVPGTGRRNEKKKLRVKHTLWKDANSKGAGGRGGAFILIKNNDELCCARAIVTSKAWVDKDPHFDTIKRGDVHRNTMQKRLARELMQEAGLGVHQGGCGKAELLALQTALGAEYQVKVWSKDLYNAIFFEGPKAEKRLCLYLDDGHYDVIRSMPAFYDSCYYCFECDKPYAWTGEHRCGATCVGCGKEGKCEEGAVVECKDCNRRFANQISLEVIQDDVIAALANKSPGVKIQTSLFLQRAIRQLTVQQLPKKTLKPITEQLTKNIQESDPEVREAAAAALGSAMKVVGEKPMMILLAPIIEETIKMEKIKEYCAKAQKDFPNIMVASMVQSLHKTRDDENSGPPAATSTGPTSKPPAKKLPNGTSAKGKPAGANKASKSANSSPAKEKNSRMSSSVIDSLDVDGGSTGRSLESARSGALKTGRGRSSSRKPGESSRAKKEEEGFEGGAIIDSGEKEKRFQEEKALKILKWQFATPDEERIEQLKLQLSTVSKAALHTQLFHSDFKQHIKACEAMILSLEQCPDACIGASDLLLKWCTLRFFDTNPSVLVKCLDFIIKLFYLMDENDVKLHEMEANAFVPFLLLKAGESKDVVKQYVKQILDMLCQLYSASKLFPLILEGTKCKNSRQKAVCLEQLAYMVEVFGVEVCGPPQGVLKTIAQIIGDRDSNVRNAALSVMVAAYMHIGERLYKYVASIGNKEMAMLEERIKRTTKNKPLIKKPSPPQDRKVVAGGRKPGRGVTPVRGAGGTRVVSGKPADSGPMENGGTEGSSEETEDPTPRQHASSSGVKPWEKGKYHLDEEDFDVSIFKFPHHPLDLYDHKETYEILKLPPLQPVIRTKGFSPLKRRGSSSSVTSMMSMDTSMALDTVIGQVTSPSITTAIQALAQLDELVKDSMRSTLLMGKVDQVLVAVYFQFRMAFNTHMGDVSIDKAHVVHLYRNLVNTLISLLSCGDLPKEASRGPLKDLSCQLLTVLLDERLQEAPDGSQVVRSINLLIVKVVEKADQTNCLVAFMQLLRETLNNPTSSSKFQELVMKCIWKQCKRLSETVEDMAVEKIVEEANQFYLQFPPEYWKEKPDTPMRTIKTILNCLAKGLGDRVLDHVGVIDNWQNSEVVVYLKKSLREIAKQNGGVVPSNPPKTSKKSPDVNVPGMVLTESTHNTQEKSMSVSSSSGRTNSSDVTKALGDIFKAIADKENSKQGIEQLYDYLNTHPNADMTQFMGKSTQFFQNYVQRGLEQIEKERLGSTGQPAAKKPKAKDMAPNIEIKTSLSGAYLDKLQELRAKAGLAPSDVNVKRISADDGNLPELTSSELSDAAKKEISPVKENQGDADTAPSQLPKPDFSDLKRRLELIKRGSQL